jgi:hypothetical protein
LVLIVILRKSRDIRTEIDQYHAKEDYEGDP